MMKYLIDTHTHTIASGHAYNTIDEMTRYAGSIGLLNLAITEHAPQMPGSSSLLYFINNFISETALTIMIPATIQHSRYTAEA
jgi:histidinol phosphatase-like PHP family hydrolase